MYQKESTWKQELEKFQANTYFLDEEYTDLRKDIFTLKNKLTARESSLQEVDSNGDEFKKTLALQAFLDATKRFFAKINAAMGVAARKTGAQQSKPMVNDAEIRRACAEYDTELTKVSFTPSEYGSAVVAACLIGAATAVFTFSLRLLAIYLLCHMPVIGTAFTGWASTLLIIAAAFSTQEGIMVTHRILNKAEHSSFKESCRSALAEVPLIRMFTSAFNYLEETFSSSEKATPKTIDSTQPSLSGDFIEERTLGLKVMGAIQEKVCEKPPVPQATDFSFSSLFTSMANAFIGGGRPVQSSAHEGPRNS